MKLGFYYAYPAQWDWNDGDLDGAGVGGTETALIHISRQMALANDVTVFNRTAREGVFHGVTYRNIARLGPGEEWDAFVLLRGRLDSLPEVRARTKVYWCIEEDAVLVGDWNRVLPYVDAVFTISPYHTQELTRRCAVPRGIIHETRLGICRDEYARPLPKEPGKLIYCSVPGRGLPSLASVFPRIRTEHPGARLVVTSDYSLWGRAAGSEGYRDLFAGMPGVEFLGNIPRPRLIEEQKTSVLHVYPCTVAELFCLASIECQAAGTPTVGTALGALNTTVADGVTGLLVQPLAGDYDAFHARLAAAASSLLGDPQRLQRMARMAADRAAGEFTYERIAAEWLALFRRWAASQPG